MINLRVHFKVVTLFHTRVIIAKIKNQKIGYPNRPQDLQVL